MLFCPLDATGAEISRVPLDEAQLQQLRGIVQLALDHSPHTAAFRHGMEPARALLGNSLDAWLDALASIKGGENPRNSQFLLDDWISEWRVVDYVDAVWTVARLAAQTNALYVDDTITTAEIIQTWYGPPTEPEPQVVAQTEPVVLVEAGHASLEITTMAQELQNSH